jgi:hypothetical protein
VFSGQPYTLDLPAGWTVFDLSNPASKTALDAFVAANPKMATAVKAFQSTPNVRMAVNSLLGNVIVSIAIPTGGVPLDTIGQSMTAQFKAVPGVVGVPTATPVTLPAGPALHWMLTISANSTAGTTTKATESIYLVTDGTNAVLVEFVAIQGAAIPQEQSIIQSLRFQP